MALAAAEQLIGDGTGEEMNAYALIIAAGAIAATEPVG